MHKYDMRPLMDDLAALAGTLEYSADPASPRYAPRWLKLATDLRVGGGCGQPGLGAVCWVPGGCQVHGWRVAWKGWGGGRRQACCRGPFGLRVGGAAAVG
jgi:hypothetical protein